MEKRIALELRGRTPSQVRELNLDNCRGTAIEGLTEQYVHLETLSLNNVGLTSLKGFPALPALRKLELSDNRISSGLAQLHGCPKLASLNLSGNKVKELDTLKPLAQLERLRNLDLFNNEVTSTDDYRNKLFALLPNIKYLDGFDAQDMEAEEDSEVEMNGNDDSDEDEGSEEDDEDVSLSAVYNDNLEEEESSGSVYEGEVEEEEDEEAADDDDEDAPPHNTTGGEEESTRGKKRKHEEEEPGPEQH